MGHFGKQMYLQTGFRKRLKQKIGKILLFFHVVRRVSDTYERAFVKIKITTSRLFIDE
jgi:hypothetical protein